jgi:hypothetical protein
MAPAGGADGKSVGTTRGRNIRWVARRLRAEEGFALPTVLLLLVAAFAFVVVGVTATITVERGTVRDEQTKAAVQLAETGVSQAVLAYNRLTPSPTNPCSPVSLSPPDTNRWCQGPAGTLNGGTYNYRVQVPPVDAQGRFVAGSDGNVTLRIVGWGTMGNATRRVLVDADSLSNQPFNGDYQVRSGGDITLDGNATIRAGVATNGGIVLNNQSRVCGGASVGIGRTLSGSGGYYTDSNCTQHGTAYGQQELNLPPLGPVPTTSDDARLFPQDPVSSGNKSNACFDGHDGNVPSQLSLLCGARELNLKQNTAVTLAGSVYVLCKLSMDQNTSLTLAVTDTGQPKQVRIYFDSPENCNYPSGTAQLDMKSNSRITSNGGGKADVQLLFVGSTSTPFRQTFVNMASNTDQNAACEQNFIVYAPLSDVVLKGANSTQGSTYCGALAGRTVHLESNVSLVSGRFDLSIQPPVPYYQATQFRECLAAAGTAPNYDSAC